MLVHLMQQFYISIFKLFLSVWNISCIARIIRT